MKTVKMVEALKESGQDYEWYPTTDEIIECVKKDIEVDHYDPPTVLDCGAGDGRMLRALTTNDRYAIERAEPLLKTLDKDIFIVGTEFDEQTLIDKCVDVVFSNPPYSVFEQWAVKIIEEANAGVAYLVIPVRWKTSSIIQEALEARDVEATVLGSFSFRDGDRAARTDVDVVKVALTRYASRYGKHTPDQDPFDSWFNKYFKKDVTEEDEEAEPGLKTKVKHELVTGADLISVLHQLYLRDLDHLISNYQRISELDKDLLKEFDVDVGKIKKAFKLRISGLKDKYWHELFRNFSRITDRLTSDSRKAMLNKLTSHTHVDFTISNIHAVIIWVINNTNAYLDNQLIKVFERMVEKASIINYKSNQRTFKDEAWRYSRIPENLERYGLDYRIICERMGGIHSSFWHDDVNGLSKHAAEFFDDICAIAINIGFDTFDLDRCHNFTWESNKKQVFHYNNNKTGELDTLFECRAFKNGNLHIKFNQKFIRRLNVEFGRLKGWVKSAEEAADEMGIKVEEAQSYFGTNKHLPMSYVAQLTHQ